MYNIFLKSLTDQSDFLFLAGCCWQHAYILLWFLYYNALAASVYSVYLYPLQAGLWQRCASTGVHYLFSLYCIVFLTCQISSICSLHCIVLLSVLQITSILVYTVT